MAFRSRLRITMWRTRGLPALISVLLAALIGLSSRMYAEQAFRAWIGLYDSSQLGWLENENRIKVLCSDPATLTECYAERLGPSVRTYDLHRQPDQSSPRIGDLIVVAVPGRGLSSHFSSATSNEAVDFTPDLYLQDWGYGPYFHQTMTGEQEDWFQLPPGPWAESVWFHRVTESEVSTVISIQAGDIIEMGGSGWYVFDTRPDALLLRPEQPGDHWCQEGEPPPIMPVEPTRRSRAELLNSRGHLVFTLKYMKGC